MTTIDLEFDEARGNPPTPECFASLAKTEDLYKATKKIFPYDAPADADPAFMVAPFAFFENMVRKGPVPDHGGLKGIHLLTRCLELYGYVKPIIETLIDEGLLVDDNGGLVVFDDPTAFYARADELMNDLKDSPSVVCDHTCWESYEANTHGHLNWLDAPIGLDRLTALTSDLSLYCDVNMMLGPRAIDADRSNMGSQLYQMAWQPPGGTSMLVAAITRQQFGKGAVAIAPAYAANLLPAFLYDSSWKEPYNLEYSTLIEYSFEVPRRAEWSTAEEAIWPLLIAPKAARSFKMDPLQQLLWSCANIHEQIDTIRRVGEALLDGPSGAKHPLKNVKELNRRLAADHRHYIAEKFAAGTLTAEMADHIVDTRPRQEAAGGGEALGPQGGAGAADNGDASTGAKRAQVRRALGEESYLRIETKWFPILKDTTGAGKDVVAMMDQCFTSTSMLPKAVILATPGMRLAPYYADSDFLDLLKDENDGLPLYLGQCVAYDEDDDEVPEGLTTYQLDPAQMQKVRELKWTGIEPLKLVLAVKSKQTTANFPAHSASRLYHLAHGLELATGVMNKLYKGLGFPDSVPAAQGWSYSTFAKKLKRLNQATIGMEPAAATRMHAFVDKCVDGATTAAAQGYRRAVYGASPADKSVGAWLGSSHPVYTEMVDALDALKKLGTFQRALPGVFGGGATAGAIPGLGAGPNALEAVEVDDVADGLTPSQRRKQAKAAAKQARKAAAGAGNVIGGPVNNGDGGGGGAGLAVNDLRNRLNGPRADMSKEDRQAHNPQAVFYYDDGKFSKGAWLHDFPGICNKYGWDHKLQCGPVVMTAVTKKRRDFDCMDAQHRWGAPEAHHNRTQKHRTTHNQDQRMHGSGSERRKPR